MKPQIRYSLENRAMLDMVSVYLRKHLDETATNVSVHVSHREHFLDLAARFGDIAGHLHEDSLLDAPIGVYLPDLVSFHDDIDLLRHGLPDRFVLAFRNRLSHKPLLYRDWGGYAFAKLEQSLSQTHRLYASIGIGGPFSSLHLLAAETARRFGRHDLAHFIADPGELAPISYGVARFAAPLGVISGVSR